MRGTSRMSVHSWGRDEQCLAAANHPRERRHGALLHADLRDPVGGSGRRGENPTFRLEGQDSDPQWGASIVDHHGMTEVGPVSYSCPKQPGVLHVIESSFIAEVIDPESAKAVEPGSSGELVLTNLGRTGSPLLRYRTGDVVQAAKE